MYFVGFCYTDTDGSTKSILINGVLSNDKPGTNYNISDSKNNYVEVAQSYINNYCANGVLTSVYVSEYSCIVDPYNY